MEFAKASKSDLEANYEKGEHCRLEVNFNGGKECTSDGLNVFGKIWLGGPDAYKHYGILK